MYYIPQQQRQPDGKLRGASVSPRLICHGQFVASLEKSQRRWRYNTNSISLLFDLGTMFHTARYLFFFLPFFFFYLPLLFVSNNFTAKKDFDLFRYSYLQTFFFPFPYFFLSLLFSIYFCFYFLKPERFLFYFFTPHAIKQLNATATSYEERIFVFHFFL